MTGPLGIAGGSVFTPAKTAQTQNLVYAGPASAPAALPTFRALVAADLPDLSGTYSPVAHLHDAAYVALAPTTSARNVIQPTLATVIPFVVKGAAAQSANLVEISPTGLPATRGVRVYNDGRVAINSDVASAALAIASNGGYPLYLYSSLNYALYATSLGTHVAQFISGAATTVGLLVKGAASQSANLQEWQDSAGAVKASMSPAALFTVSNIKLNYSYQNRILWHDGTYNLGAIAIDGNGLVQFLVGNGLVTRMSLSYEGLVTVRSAYGATNAALTTLDLSASSSGTPVAGFGTGVVLKGQSSTTADRDMARIRAEWTDATDASRTSKLVLSTYNVASEVNAVTIDHRGYVGINTAPSYALHVNGIVGMGYGSVVFGIDSQNKIALSGSAHFTNDVFFYGSSKKFVFYDDRILGFGGGAGTQDISLGWVNADDTLRFAGGTDLTATPWMTLKGGNVGIGTTSPGARLAVARLNTDTFPNIELRTTMSDAPGAYTLPQDRAIIDWSMVNSSPYTRYLDLRARGAGDGTNGASAIRFFTSPITTGAAEAERMRIDGAGNVGIGTTAPGGTLPNLFSSPNRVLEIVSPAWNQDAGVFIRRSGLDIGLDLWADGDGGYAMLDSRHDTYGFKFRTKTATAALDAMTILADGNVGIGITTPGVYRLAIAGGNLRLVDMGAKLVGTSNFIQLETAGGALNAASKGNITLNIDSDNNGTAHFFGIYKNVEDGSGTPLFRVQEDGNVGIGTTAPAARLHVVEPTADDALLVERTVLGAGFAPFEVFDGVYSFLLGWGTAQKSSNWLAICRNNSQSYISHSGGGFYFNAPLVPTAADNITNAATNVLTLGHNTSGTPAAGFGAGLLFQLESSTTENRDAAAIEAVWNTATDASRAAQLVGSAYDTAKREGWRIGANGSAATLGFFGVTPVVRPTALTAQLTTLTFTAPGTPDYAIQDFTQSTPWGFASQDEARTVLSTVANLQTRLAELETKLQALGLLN